MTGGGAEESLDYLLIVTGWGGGIILVGAGFGSSFGFISTLTGAGYLDD